jgi:hypothetical protein
MPGAERCRWPRSLTSQPTAPIPHVILTLVDPHIAAPAGFFDIVETSAVPTDCNANRKVYDAKRIARYLRGAAGEPETPFASMA